MRTELTGISQIAGMLGTSGEPNIPNLTDLSERKIKDAPTSIPEGVYINNLAGFITAVGNYYLDARSNYRVISTGSLPSNIPSNMLLSSDLIVANNSSLEYRAQDHPDLLLSRILLFREFFSGERISDSNMTPGNKALVLSEQAARPIKELIEQRFLQSSLILHPSGNNSRAYEEFERLAERLSFTPPLIEGPDFRIEIKAIDLALRTEYSSNIAYRKLSSKSQNMFITANLTRLASLYTSLAKELNGYIAQNILDFKSDMLNSHLSSLVAVIGQWLLICY